jgi:hypothetical protein
VGIISFILPHRRPHTPKKMKLKTKISFSFCFVDSFPFSGRKESLAAVIEETFQSEEY